MTLADPHKRSSMCVRLEFGGSTLPNPSVLDIDDTPTVIRLTDLSDEVTVDGEVYTPALVEVKLGKSTATLEESPTTIEVLRSYIDDEMSLGPFARVAVRITEVVTGDSGDEILVPFIGYVFRTTRNPQGHDETDLLTCYTAKKMLSQQLNLPADHQCVWQLFGPGCLTVNTETGPPSAPTAPASQGPIVDDYISACTLTSAVGDLVTVTDLIDVGTLNGPLWDQGYLEYRGLRLKIRGWDAVVTPIGGGLVTTTFQLVKPPPASWIGSVMRAVPGCPKTVEACRERYDNEPNFCGPGYATLPYNPLLESP